ncbi:MAG: OmpA family protein [Nitrosomonas sp.]|nr:OmpA family protein [Nitrosomonas sp.]MDP1949535.1 OmpA family protein [Nitrosomonas sp.]
MKIISTKKYLLGMLVLPVIFSGTAIAADEHESTANKAEAYAVDDRGVVVRNAYDECWRTGYWTPAMAIFECDPDLVKKPEQVAAAPAPAPVPAPTPPVAHPTVTFSADALFDFDSARLKPAGIQALDEFARGLTNIQYDLITAIGYADRIGADNYNKNLSLRRAEAVKNHLVTVDGIDPSRVFAEGRGEANPVTGNACHGLGSGNALKDCLAPDRRVEIEVTGTR